MNKFLLAFSVIIASLSSFYLQADDTKKPVSGYGIDDEEPAVSEAFKTVGDNLRDPNKRDQMFKDMKDDKTQEQTANLSSNPSTQQDIYSLTADILPYMQKASNGDPDKMNKMMQDYQRNPAAFADSLPPEIKAKLKGVAVEVESDHKVKP